MMMTMMRRLASSGLRAFGVQPTATQTLASTRTFATFQQRIARGHLMQRWQPTRAKSDAVTKGTGKGGNKQLASEKPFAELTVAEKVVETGKDAGSVSVIAIGFGLGFLFLVSIGKQLLFKETPRTVYTDTIKKLKKSEELEDVLGTIETGSVGAGFNPFRATEYIAGDNNLLRMEFQIKGTRGTGVAYLEMKKPTSLVGSTLKSYRYRYLFVDCKDDATQQTKRIILEDNRAEDN
ncbi:hypothetical protein PTSG_12559 [Salpingoeca rosetta]|uniref:Mitochondrial import inner membrane translocase subunit Tim21 n=1 Tax=Salpingoeca rosetta (strain ATCC 50818 / BSB-021) TaxID=946362 RepID=F2UEE9_SALR5|nr:uncharacterized protein PTSG_12559 [Salpingoeca rosetta]EGD74999.1 hypothetical protein PTSG_12559 [Salpingoeca rosetta]|eukprot:XP_004992643.1 hypothetical protein PTSG_12559 [Salpingoeca rosetta]